MSWRSLPRPIWSTSSRHRPGSRRATGSLTWSARWPGSGCWPRRAPRAGRPRSGAWPGPLLLAREAHAREYSGDYLLSVGRARRWPLPQPLVDQLLKDPLAWYERERSFLASVVHQAAENDLVGHAWELAISTVALYEARCYFEDWRQTHEAALKAACRNGDERGEAAMRYSLGSLYLFEQRNEQALRQFTLAIELYRWLGDQHGAALVLRNIATLDRRSGNLQAAMDRWESALGVFQIVGTGSPRRTRCTAWRRHTWTATTTRRPAGCWTVRRRSAGAPATTGWAPRSRSRSVICACARGVGPCGRVLCEGAGDHPRVRRPGRRVLRHDRCGAGGPVPGRPAPGGGRVDRGGAPGGDRR
ncbi:tetratricopeptide repeat protein [Streptacidiphilus sp. 4-A2]|nr:tetratricopeptide repeat protein [Streptacidiphilus sp. 4-A2]